MFSPIAYLKDFLQRWKQIIKSWKKNLVRLHFIDDNFAHDLQQQYSHLFRKPEIRNLLRMKEKKIYSQHGEDGLILHFLDKIGAENMVAAEFGIGGGRECNTANLSINFGWHTLLIEGDRGNFEEATNFYANHPLVGDKQVTLLNHFVDTDNIDDLLKKNLPVEAPDLLSIDIDGNDYWIWEAIRGISPRLVVIEYNSSLGRDRSVSVKYDPSFDRFQKHSSGFYHGATLPALTRLASQKGYSLVGCESHGINAFYMREDLAEKHNVEVLSPENAFYANRKRGRKMTIQEQHALIDHLELIKI